MKKPIQRVAYVDSFALLEVGDEMAFPVKDRPEPAVRAAAWRYSAKYGVTLSVTFDRQRLASIVTRTA